CSAATIWPFGEKATKSVVTGKRPTILPLATSIRVGVPLVTKTVLESGENAREVTPLIEGRFRILPVVASHNRRLGYLPQDANILPSGENATAFAEKPCRKRTVP